MPHLEDLKKSLVEMSPDELREKVRAIREDRKLKKTAPKARKERIRTKDDAQTGLKKMMAGLSPEEIEALMAELEG